MRYQFTHYKLTRVTVVQKTAPHAGAMVKLECINITDKMQNDIPTLANGLARSLKVKYESGVVVHTCNSSSTWEAEAAGS
jgi:hypothetical protein